MSGLAGRPFHGSDRSRRLLRGRLSASRRASGGQRAAAARHRHRLRPRRCKCADGRRWRRRRPLVDGLPLLKPPYGTISAINLDRGEIVWQIAHGDTPDNVRNHPALKGLNIPKTGQAGTGGIGLMVTKSLVVMGDPQLTTTPEHPRGAMLRAYDKANGKEVGALWMAAPQSGSPMTYLADGKQYIVVAISGGNYSGEYVAFTLPGR